MTRVNLILLVGLACLSCLSLQTVSAQRHRSYDDNDDQDQGSYYEEENLPPLPPQRRTSPPKASSSRGASSAAAPSAPRAPPVGILKQINKHNEDGSYTYGYEGEDGSFKIETKLPTGEVMGKYGYVDDVGKVRVVEYGANRYGFMPSGEGITVAEPTIVEETTDKNGNIIEEDEIEQEPLAQRPVLRPAAAPRPVAKVVPRPAPRPAPRPLPIEFEEPEQFEPAPPRTVFQPAPQAAPKPKYSPSPIEHSFTSALPSSSRSNSAPAPPRPSFSYAAPIPVSRSSSPSSPPRPASPISQSFPVADAHAPSRSAASRPSPLDSFNLGGPAPVYEEPLPPSRPAPRPAPARLPVPQRSVGGGVLDQLAKDYALPEGGSRRAVDISFSTI